MGLRNYMIDGGSGTGKTAVCNELQRRGYQAIHGDRELKIKPKIDETTSGPIPGYDLPPLWDVAKVNALIASHEKAVTFFCGGCSNSSKFIERLDGVFILEVNDIDIVMRRIDERVLVDPTDWGGKQEEREIIIRAHQTRRLLRRDGQSMPPHRSKVSLTKSFVALTHNPDLVSTFIHLIHNHRLKVDK